MDSFQWHLYHLQLKLYGGRTIVEVTNEAEHFRVHRHEDSGSEGTLMDIFHSDRLIGLNRAGALSSFSF